MSRWCAFNTDRWSVPRVETTRSGDPAAERSSRRRQVARRTWDEAAGPTQTVPFRPPCGRGAVDPHAP